MLKKEKLVIGRSERIDLPDLGLKNINAKIDTGAYSSAIHSYHIHIQTIKGIEVLTFELLDPSHPKYERKTFKVKNFKLKKVKNSFGSAEKRYTIQSTITIFKRKIKAEFTLTNRSEMRFPILLGRKFLHTGNFLVDVTKVNLSKKNKEIMYNGHRTWSSE